MIMEEITTKMEANEESYECLMDSDSDSIRLRKVSIGDGATSTSGVSSTLSYGKDLWDCLSVLTDNTVERT